MSKKQINNEIILLRGSVEQARVQLIAKLARDAFKLREKKGTEQQKAKNIRKADRIAAEILAIKKYKKDAITKYVLTNTLNLDEILKDQKSEPLTKIMARIANHKKFSEKIAEFKSKYPNYAEFLGPGRKKKAILEWKENKKLRKAQNQKNDESGTNASDAEASENHDESSDNESEPNDNDVSENEEVSSDAVKQEEESEDSSEEKVTTVKPAKVKKSKKCQAKDVTKEKDKNVGEKNVESTKSVKGKKNKKLKVKNNVVKQENESKDLNNEGVKNKIVKLESVANNKVKKERDAKEVKSKIEKLESVENGTEKKEKSKNLLGKRKKANKEEEQSTHTDVKPDIKKKKTDTSKVISKQAIVKKFTDILKEEESKSEVKPAIESDSETLNLKIEKEVDSFFFSGDGRENYLSVALPKNNSNEEEEEYGNDRFNKKKFSRQQNDKFFSNVNKFQNNGFDNFNSNRSDSRREDRRNNERPYGRDKPGFNKFNGKSNDRFNDRSNNRFNGKPNDRFNDRPNNKFNDRPNNKFNDKPNNKFGNNRNDKPFKNRGKDSFESKSNEILHPSWEAKKKQQDILKKGFQGKKIVFGDDV